MFERDDLLQDFLVECHESLDRLDGDFVALEEDPSSTDRLSSIFRTFHTIKGSCGFLDLVRLEAVTHAGENLLSALRDGRVAVGEDVTSTLLLLVDAVREILAHVEATGEENDLDYGVLIAALERLQEPPDPAGGEAAGGEAAGAPPDGRPAGAGPLPEQAGEGPGPRLGEIMLSTGEVDEEQLLRALERQATGDSRPIGEILREVAGIAVASVSQALVHQQELADTPSSDHPTSTISGSNIRVQVDQLDKLMNLTGELVLARNQILQSATASQDAAAIATAQRLDLITTELQERIMKVRMQPVGMLWSKYPRIVRDLSKQLGKSIRLEMQGKGTELDKTILEAIKDPLTHIVRNAVDHGLETVEERAAAGKATEAVLGLAAYHESGQVFIEISDDGKGIDAEAVKAKAVANGLVTADEAAAMSERQVFSLIFRAGLSTAPAVTNVSGRGVGMDVVRTNIEKIGGAIELSSAPGKGTTVRIKIPLTLAILPALIVTVRGDRYAVPQVSLVELVRLDGDAARGAVEDLHGSPVYRLRGTLLPLVFLDELLGLGTRGVGQEGEELCRTLVVVRAGEQLFGLVVDDIIDTEEIVVKPLGQQTKAVDAYAGTTILGDGRVALILDVQGLARRAGVVAENGPDRPLGAEEAGDAAARESTRYLVFSAGDGQRLALDLRDVDRLEELSPGSIERSGGRAVVQYRGEIMPLVPVAEALGLAAPPGGAQDVGQDVEQHVVRVIVHSRGGHSVGLVVGEIADIVEVHGPVSRPSSKPGIARTVVVDGRVADVLDLEVLAAGECSESDSGAADRAGAAAGAVERTHQLCTFHLGELLFGVDVTGVQEVLRFQPMTPVPLAGAVVRGLINLRGQTVTALDARARLALPPCPDLDGCTDPDALPMNLVLRTGEGAVSLLVDRIGEVLTVEDALRAPVPTTVRPELRLLLDDVYTLEQGLLLHLDIERLVDLTDRLAA